MINMKRLVKEARKTHELRKNGEKAVVSTFRWRDRHGNFRHPADMETHHLFFTIRMIWNHNMPTKLEPYIKYYFNGFYTDAYMKKALRVMLPELFGRDDIDDSWDADLRLMVEWLSTVQIERAKAKAKHSETGILRTLK